MPLAVLFRDLQLAVVDKPAGLAVDEDVLPLAARELAPPGGRSWPRVVHRLDRGTSGCLLLALRKGAETALKSAFEEKRVEKAYLALVQGSPPDRAELDTPYGQKKNNRYEFTTHVITARRARLRYQVVERLREAALLRVDLDTGRTHQIRVQLAESGFPVFGDESYGGPQASRLMLHAERLVFPHDGRVVECVAPLPDDLRAALVQLR
ncbi:MAG: RluA family pseudouridine synthase [Myxococcales bacterium]|nr:RluA family pseudouridine synthase [Myxococcales bacterium]